MEGSDMISVVPLAVARHYANYGLLAIFPVELPILMAQLGIITPKRKEQSSAMKSFLHCLGGIILENQMAH